MLALQSINTVRTVRTSRPGAINLRQRRTWYAETATDAGTTDTQPAKEGEQQPAAKPADSVTFTQADIDRIVGERVKRAEEATTKKLTETLGVENIDAIREILEAHKTAEEAKKSEADKLNDQIKALTAKLTEAERRVGEAEKQRLADRRDNALRLALKGSSKPDSVLTLIKAEYAADIEKVLGEDGAISETQVKALVAKAEKEWPGMFTTNVPGTTSHAGGRTKTDDAAKKAAFAETLKNMKKGM